MSQSRAWYTTSVFGFHPSVSYSLVQDYVNSHEGARFGMVARLYLGTISSGPGPGTVLAIFAIVISGIGFLVLERSRT